MFRWERLHLYHSYWLMQSSDLSVAPPSLQTPMLMCRDLFHWSGLTPPPNRTCCSKTPFAGVWLRRAHTLFAETELMPLMWHDLSAWLSASIWNMYSALCLLQPFPLSCECRRLMPFSDVTMCYLFLTPVALRSTSWYPDISLVIDSFEPPRCIFSISVPHIPGGWTLDRLGFWNGLRTLEFPFFTSYVNVIALDFLLFCFYLINQFEN